MALPQRVERPRVAPPPPAPVPVAPRGREAYWLLRTGLAALLLVAGADKFLAALGPWRDYLAPDVSDLLGVSPPSIMHAVGVVEILVALMVAFRPRVGGWLLAAWLWAVVVNLLIVPGYYDIALRDLALSLAAVALARLAPR
jgi:uncharacterized membrane protein YphA (DoxX/SURF4 family)